MGIDCEKAEDVSDQKWSCTAWNFLIHANIGISPKEWKDTEQFSAKQSSVEDFQYFVSFKNGPSQLHT